MFAMNEKKYQVKFYAVQIKEANFIWIACMCSNWKVPIPNSGLLNYSLVTSGNSRFTKSRLKKRKSSKSLRKRGKIYRDLPGGTIICMLRVWLKTVYVDQLYHIMNQWLVGLMVKCLLHIPKVSGSSPTMGFFDACFFFLHIFYSELAKFREKVRSSC